mgnify:CR=1 FL=1
MTEEEILKVINLLIGEIKPYGSHGIDMDKIVPNVDMLGRIATALIIELNWTAEDFENRSESSIKAVGEKARYWIDFIEVEILETKKD